MPVAAGVVVAAASAASSIYSANKQSKAAQAASNAQASSAQAGIDSQNYQFDQIQQMLAPWREEGQKGLTAQSDLVGLSGTQAQQAAIQALQASPQFTSALQQGENSILQNASATGGLRGGNTQAALAQFSPQLLAQTINDQYSRLSGISSMGLGAAGQTGAFGQSAANNVTNLLQQQGAAYAGNALAQGKTQAQALNGVTNAIGAYYGYGGKF